MKTQKFVYQAIAFFLILLLVILGIGVIGVVVILTVNPDFQFELRLPGQKREFDPADIAPVETTFVSGEGTFSSVKSSWPNFRGPNLDAISQETVKLRNTWPENKPNLLWQRPAGDGYASAAIRNGAVYLLDYDAENNRDVLLCLSLDDGREIWQRHYPVKVTPSHGVSRTIPAVTEKHCITIGPKLHVMSVDPISGDLQWLINLSAQYRAEVPEWYAGQCPMVLQDDQGRDILILGVGGENVLMAAIDCETGEEIWQLPNSFGWTPQTHSTPMPMMLDGKPTIVYCGKGGVIGVDFQTGNVLWSNTDWKIGIATCPSPLVLPDNRIFFCGGYNAGALMMQVVKKGNSYEAQTLYKLRAKVFSSTQQTPVFHENHIFGIRQVDKLMVCLDLNGKVVWESRGQGKFGDGPYMLADGKFLIFDDFGTLTQIEATSAGYRKISETRVFDGHDAWGPFALAEGRLFARSFDEVACVDMREP